MTSESSQPTNVGSNDRLGLVTEHAKVGDAPLCDQMQALQARAMKLHPIDLHDPQLDTADPYTRLFLLAEYWQRQANEARACLDDECDRTDSLLTILGLEAERCRSEGGALVPQRVLALLADAKDGTAPNSAKPLHTCANAFTGSPGKCGTWCGDERICPRVEKAASSGVFEA